MNHLAFTLDEYITLCNFDEPDERGTVMFIHESLVQAYTQIDFPEYPIKDSVFTEIKLDNRDTTVIGCIYHHGNNGAEENEYLFHVLEKMCTGKYKHVSIAGDFNVSGIEQTSWTTKSDYYSTEFKFIECIHNCFMEQLITSLTRGRGTNKPSVLDLVPQTTQTQQMITLQDHPWGRVTTLL